MLLEKGVLPEFSKEAEEELAALNAPATADKAQIRVQLLRTDVDWGFIDFRRVSSGRKRNRSRVFPDAGDNYIRPHLL